MRNLKYLVFLLIILIPIKVDALISINCSGGAAPGKSTSCSIQSDINITSFSGSLSTGKITYSITPATGFLNQTSGSNLHLTSISGGKNVATINLTVPSNYTDKSFTIVLSNIKYIKAGDTNETSQAGSRTEIVQVLHPTTTTKAPTTTTKASGTTTTKKTATTNKTTTKASGTTTTSVPINNTVYLKSLAIEGQEIQFSKFILEYELKVLYEIESLKITAEAENAETNVVIDEEKASKLEVGDNVITINLADTSGHTNTYTLKVKRLNEGELINEQSNDMTLKSIDLGTYTIDFSPTKVNYYLTIKSNINSLSISAETNDPNATYTVEGNSDLKNESEIKIIVTAEDGTTNTYHIFITKENALSSYLVYIILGSVILLSIIVIVIKKSGTSKKPGGSPKKIGKIAPETNPIKPVAPLPKVVPTPVPSTPAEVEVLDV